jgi:peptidoglycan/LPS O-acetylase OafA/YrhL
MVSSPPPPTIESEVIQTRWVRHVHKVPALDGVRGLAILLVMAHNFDLLEDPQSITGKLAELAFNFGWAGVQLFFVLSGFLITNILVSTKTTSNYFRSFIARRALRIFLIYYLSLFVGLVLFPLITGTPPAGGENQIWLWTYLSNWAAPLGHGVDLYPHMWSLAVEEQFYLVWPVVVYVLSTRGLFRFCLGLTALALITRIGIRVLDLPVEAAYQFTICRIDAIALGGIAALAFRNRRVTEFLSQRRSVIRMMIVLGTILTVVFTNGAPRTGLLTQTYGYTLFTLLAAVFILDIANINPKRKDWLTNILSWTVLRKAGTYSYGALCVSQTNARTHWPASHSFAPGGRPHICRFRAAVRHSHECFGFSLSVRLVSCL